MACNICAARQEYVGFPTFIFCILVTIACSLMSQKPNTKTTLLSCLKSNLRPLPWFFDRLHRNNLQVISSRVLTPHERRRQRRIANSSVKTHSGGSLLVRTAQRNFSACMAMNIFFQITKIIRQTTLESLAPWHFLHDFALLSSQTVNKQLLAKCAVTKQNSAAA